ncbi:MAG: Rieske (2Fe-2S) protein [Myxococcales bacterium]|nr:Rieske (2Fe-2S) protein [Myxococcales bacterium]
MSDSSASDTPRWRRDFPIDHGDDELVSRRDLVKYVVLTSAALVAGQGWVLFESMRRRRRGPHAALPVAAIDELPVGGAKTFTYPPGSTPRLLVRTGRRSFVAYDQLCTHLQCPVVPAVAQGKLHCPCHNGWFDLATGAPLAGPPRRPLPRVALEVRDGKVFATGVESNTGSSGKEAT